MKYYLIAKRENTTHLLGDAHASRLDAEGAMMWAMVSQPNADYHVCTAYMDYGAFQCVRSGLVFTPQYGTTTIGAFQRQINRIWGGENHCFGIC